MAALCLSLNSCDVYHSASLTTTSYVVDTPVLLVPQGAQYNNGGYTNPNNSSGGCINPNGSDFGPRRPSGSNR